MDIAEHSGRCDLPEEIPEYCLLKDHIDNEMP